MNIDLKGKTALVTGAGVGIGREAALCLARAGARVALHVYRSKAGGETALKEILDAGGEAALFQADLTDVAQIRRMIEEIERTFSGTVDILFNNSGGWRAARSAKNITTASWTSI